MGIFAAILDMIESIFRGSSPEYIKKQELRKIESEVKAVVPEIYKDGMLTPEMGGILRILYDNTRLLFRILSTTIFTKDEAHNSLYEENLLETGFTSECQMLMESLSAENRKEDVITANVGMKQVFEAQRREFEKVLKEAQSENFRKIDGVLIQLKHLFDLCSYDFEEIIHKFNPEFSAVTMTNDGSYREVNLDAAGSLIQDYYFVTAGLKMNSALARAVIALNQLAHGEAAAADNEKIIACIKKINAVHTKILTPSVTKGLVLLWRKDPSYQINSTSYTVSASANFARTLKTRFESDENKIKLEIKDRNVAMEQRKLFSGRDLDQVDGYNFQTNEILRKATSFSFDLITPIQILKTFINDFLSEKVQALVEDIVIEGFFNNSQYKSDFSSRVYLVKEFAGEIKEFEDSFARGGENDVAIIKSHIEDGRKDGDFIKKLGVMVENINRVALKLIQKQVNGIKDLYIALTEIIADSKKSKSDVIGNIKVLFNSSRNRDGVQLLESQFPLWSTFFEIMKNYAIIGDIEKK